MDRKWFRLDLPPKHRLVGAVYAFIIFAFAHQELTGSPPPGMPAMDLVLFYTGFLLFPVLGSLLAALLLWFVAYMGCLLAGVSAPSFTAELGFPGSDTAVVRPGGLHQTLIRRLGILLMAIPGIAASGANMPALIPLDAVVGYGTSGPF